MIEVNSREFSQLNYLSCSVKTVEVKREVVNTPGILPVTG